MCFNTDMMRMFDVSHIDLIIFKSVIDKNREENQYNW